MKIIRVKHTDINNYNLFTCFGGKTLYRHIDNMTECDARCACSTGAKEPTDMITFKVVVCSIYTGWFHT